MKTNNETDYDFDDDLLAYVQIGPDAEGRLVVKGAEFEDEPDEQQMRHFKTASDLLVQVLQKKFSN